MPYALTLHCSPCAPANNLQGFKRALSRSLCVVCFAGAETLLLVALKPPYSLFHVVLLGPPLLAVWVALSYYDFVPEKDVPKAVQRESDKKKAA
jgi:hypothetical protein